ncbi:MAG: hypothetical protein WBL43_11780 [Pseudolabrys sp.]
MRQGFLRTLSVGLLAAGAFVDPAAAQVAIPYGDFGDGFEKYLVAFITLVLLSFAMWRFFLNRSSLRARFDRASFQ